MLNRLVLALGVETHLPELHHAITSCEKHFGRDLLEKIDPANPVFYTPYDWRAFHAKAGPIPQFEEGFFDEPDCDFYAQ